MSTFTDFTIQVVFASKYRKPFLNQSNGAILFKYLGGVLKGLNCHPIEIGGYKDHIHILFSFSKNIPVSKTIQELKKNSNVFMNKEKGIFPNFTGWQIGYGAFTYHSSDREKIARYIRNQHEHHKKMSFKVEYINILKAHNITYNEKYLFSE